MSRGAGDKVGDSAIMNATRQEVDDKNQVRLCYVLQSGEALWSDWVPEGQLKAQAIMAWCDSVRHAITLEHEQTLPDTRGLDDPPAPVPEPEPEPDAAAEPASTALLDDPNEFISNRKALWEAEAVSATLDLAIAQERSDKAEESLRKWSALAEGLSMQEKEEE